MIQARISFNPIRELQMQPSHFISLRISLSWEIITEPLKGNQMTTTFFYMLMLHIVRRKSIKCLRI